MKALFVTATGTDVGKTYVTAGILRAARQLGHLASAIKPLMSGYDAQMPQASDAGVLLEAMGKRANPGTIAASPPGVTPPRFHPTWRPPVKGAGSTCPIFSPSAAPPSGQHPA